MFIKLQFLTAVIGMCLPLDLHAGTATQTDWSGGEGVWGPVTDWGTEFYADTDIECYISPSSILLQKVMLLTPLEYTVGEDIDGAVSVYSADLNGDTYTDVLGAGYLCGDIVWWENDDGTGTSWTKHTVDANFAGAHSVFSADVNGDGHLDVLGASRADDDITWWENMDGLGTSWTEHVVDGEFDSARSVYAADVNADGHIDVLGAAESDHDITWWENVDGTGTSWTEHVVDSEFYSAVSVYSEDINGDGSLDVLGASETGDDITWWENIDGTGTSWTEHIVDGSFDGAVSVHSQDVNGDGYMDVLGAAFNAHDVTWWENVDGTGTSWTEHIVDDAFHGAYSAYAADVNRDGYMDVLGTAYYAGAVVWWENLDGSGTSWIDHSMGEYGSTHSAISTDINGDGWLDVLASGWFASKVTWWDLTEYLPGGSLESSVLDVQESPDWQTIDWTCTEPAGTSLGLQVRASSSSSSMGEWSDTLTAPCSLEGLLADEDNYFQYRAILNTTSSLISPALHDVTVVWQPYSGTEEESGAEISVFAMYGASPNPVTGTAVLSFSLPADSRVGITVFDLSGRAVHTTCEEFCSGVHEVPVNDLACGVYLVRLTSGELTETGHFVVIE